MTPTLAKKFEAVHNITVARRRTIPIECRQITRREFWCRECLLSETSRDLCDHDESVDLLTVCVWSDPDVDTGKPKLSAGTMTRD